MSSISYCITLYFSSFFDGVYFYINNKLQNSFRKDIRDTVISFSIIAITNNIHEDNSVMQPVI